MYYAGNQITLTKHQVASPTAAGVASSVSMELTRTPDLTDRGGTRVQLQQGRPTSQRCIDHLEEPRSHMTGLHTSVNKKLIHDDSPNMKRGLQEANTDVDLLIDA